MRKIKKGDILERMEPISALSPLISIVVLARGDDHLLHLTFESIASQEEKNFEVILLDATGRASDLAHRFQGFPVQIQEARMNPLAVSGSRRRMAMGLFLITWKIKGRC